MIYKTYKDPFMMKHILFNNPSNIYLEKILIIKTHLVALHIILSFLFLSKPSDNILSVTTPKEFLSL
jgi:hypothetical protein